MIISIKDFFSLFWEIVKYFLKIKEIIGFYVINRLKQILNYVLKTNNAMLRNVQN